jgi:protein arginine kinase activator
MLCQSCNEQAATIHLTEITEGLRAETHLCEACAQKQGLAVKSQIPINELLSTLLAVQSESGAGPDLSADIQCPSCGMTLKQFAEKSLLGCPHDYDVFSEQLKMIIERAHNGNTRHCGKTPSTAPAEDRDRIKLMNLKQQLEDAVRDEDYETAAKVRDMIEKMK